MAVSVFSRIAQLHEPVETWVDKDWPLKAGELGIELDTDRIKSGEDSSEWTTIPRYLGEVASDLTFDPTGTTLSSLTVQSAIDEIRGILP